MSSDLAHTLNILKATCRYNQWIYSHIEPYLSGSVLDIGSGLGDIVSLFRRPQIEEVILSDCEENFVVMLKQYQFSLRKYSVVALDINQDKTITQLKNKKIDTITCVNVLEHIENDMGALRRMQDILRPGGIVVILVPALLYLYGTLDASVGHQRRYTQQILETRIKSVGFNIKDWRYMNIFGALTWFLAGRVLKQKRFVEKTCHQLDKIVPLLQWVEQGFRPPWGQSLVMVGQKPEKY